METLAINCTIESYSVSEPSRYFVDSIRVIEFETTKTFLNKSEVIRKALDFYVSTKYPHLFNDVKEFIKE